MPACCCAVTALAPATAGELGAYGGLSEMALYCIGDQAAPGCGYTEMARIPRAASGG